MEDRRASAHPASLVVCHSRVQVSLFLLPVLPLSGNFQYQTPLISKCGQGRLTTTGDGLCYHLPKVHHPNTEYLLTSMFTEARSVNHGRVLERVEFRVYTALRRSMICGDSIAKVKQVETHGAQQMHCEDYIRLPVQNPRLYWMCLWVQSILVCIARVVRVYSSGRTAEFGTAAVLG